ncbi:unnamed protein product [Nezara viridula]|uniref:Bro-N domain-containing protein n=1 Tax=Nezara viridula TaxID=85310 RepID=A0A9P0HG26_NEZVI|nr:unnamed protein product [Nezara viridula]
MRQRLWREKTKKGDIVSGGGGGAVEWRWVRIIDHLATRGLFALSLILGSGAEDIAKILGFENPSAIERLLDVEDGYTIQGSLFIYEHGLYALITKSKNREQTLQFKKWAIKEIDRKKNEQIRRYSLRLRNKAIESLKRKKDEIIYISSSENYAKQRRFKIGGVGSPERLDSRLANYNGRSAEGDEWGYCLKMNVPSFRQFESRIWDHLKDFRDKPRKEIVKMDYQDLKEIVTLTAENYNKEVDFMNDRRQRYIENVNNNRAQPVPVPIETKAIIKKKELKKSYIILPDYDELKREIKKYMNDEKANSNTPSVVLLRTEVLEHCTKKFKKYNKKVAWNIMKEIADEQKEFRLIYYS